MSLGHFILCPFKPARVRARAVDSATTRGKQPSSESCFSNFQPSHRYRFLPNGECHPRPRLPRPEVCCSARITLPCCCATGSRCRAELVESKEGSILRLVSISCQDGEMPSRINFLLRRSDGPPESLIRISPISVCASIYP